MVSKTQLALEIAADLKNLAARIEAFVKEVDTTGKTTQALLQPEEAKLEPITIEQVRVILAEKSQSGKQPGVKALITKYGAKKLTDIDHANYPELLKEAEAL